MDEYFAHLAKLDPMIMFQMAKAMRNNSAKDLLPEITVPTLILAGAKDVMTPPKLAEEMAEAIPNARLEMFEDGSHTLPIDEPARVNALVEEFVCELAQAELGERNG